MRIITFHPPSDLLISPPPITFSDDRITVIMDQAKLAKMQQSVRIVGEDISSRQDLHFRGTCIAKEPVRILFLSLNPQPQTPAIPNPREDSGKGTPRRKVKKVTRNSGADDKKLQATLKKMNVQPIQAIEEVNMFKEDGNVIHFAAPRVHASVPSNTFALYGNGEEKELTELVPGILNQLGPDSLASLRKLAESYQNMQKAQGGDKKDDDEDDIPDLVEGENFESKVE
ncbi:hypothetical protein PENDEC_c006G00189 [Penicillium decumbens]|uniref:Nascent polypeptide-associated complex subunit beta n=1 Tax=Penicillium decumbens TaxID=69771 RepID=A0A1V6PFI1_PENDC|nr:hypothetical protein PENDEC_c006G00189 [Penicillium decumbens]